MSIYQHTLESMLCPSFHYLSFVLFFILFYFFYHGVVANSEIAVGDDEQVGDAL
jgi:hypothetical protein